MIIKIYLSCTTLTPSGIPSLYLGSKTYSIDRIERFRDRAMDLVESLQWNLTDPLYKSFIQKILDLKTIRGGRFAQAVAFGGDDLEHPWIVSVVGFPVGQRDDRLEREASNDVMTDHNGRSELGYLASPLRIEPNHPYLALGYLSRFSRHRDPPRHRPFPTSLCDRSRP